jgi:EAL and modified HD-GYP domain-containing signal transduction protein
MKHKYLARQPIVDSDFNIISYELLYRDSLMGIKVLPKALIATQEVISSTLHDILNILPIGTKGFVNCDDTVVLSNILDKLDPEKFVIELLEDTVITSILVEKLHEYYTKGFTIAIDDFNCSEESYNYFKPILEYVSIVKICLHEIDLDNYEKSEKCCQLLSQGNILLLAEKVETEEELTICKDLGFTLFQGYFTGKPEVLVVN